MAKMSDIIRGLEIISTYCDPDAHLGGADYEVIFAPPLKRPLSEEHERELELHGWFVSSDTNTYAHYC